MVADNGRGAHAGGRPEKTESERLRRPSGTLTTSKTRAYSEFPKGNRSLGEIVKHILPFPDDSCQGTDLKQHTSLHTRIPVKPEPITRLLRTTCSGSYAIEC